MITRLKQFIKDHTLLSLYTLILVLLLYGIMVVSGTRYLGLMGALILSFYGFYFLLFKLGFKKFIERLFAKISLKLNPKQHKTLVLLLTVYTIGSVIAHFVVMGGSPPIMSLGLENADDVAAIRRSITSDSLPLMNYVSSFTIRAFLPFLIFYFFVKDQKRAYYLILIVGSFYAFSLMQKSYIITLLAPVFIYALLNKRWLHMAKHVFLMLSIIIGLSFFANPEIRHELSEDIPELELDDLDAEPKRKMNGVERILYGLYTRVLVIPGEMVAEWFEKVPEDKPFLYGNGYRLIAKLKGEEFQNYQAELYPLIRPNFARRGLRGNVNTASFMYDYANFGVYGLIFGGLSLALLFLVVEALFLKDFLNKLSLNLFSILIISSTALTTTLFSGGWAFVLILYFIFLRNQPILNSKSEEN